MLKWMYNMQPAHLAPNAALQEDTEATSFIEKCTGEGTCGKHCSE